MDPQTSDEEVSDEEPLKVRRDPLLATERRTSSASAGSAGPSSLAVSIPADGKKSPGPFQRLAGSMRRRSPGLNLKASTGHGMLV